MVKYLASTNINKSTTELLTLLTNQKSIKEVLNLCQKIIGAPVMYSDHILDNYILSDDYSLGLSKNAAEYDKSANILKYNSNYPIKNKTVNNNEPFIIKTDSGDRFFISKIYYGSEHVGNIVIPERNLDLDLLNKELIKQIGIVISILKILRKNESTKKNFITDENHIFKKILYRKYNTINDLNVLSSSYSFNRYNTYRIIGIPLTKNTVKVEELIEKLSSKTKKNGLGFWTHTEDRTLIILLGFNSNTIDVHNFLKTIEKQFKNDNVSLFISDPFHHILAIENHFKNIKSIIKIRKDIISNNKIFFYDDFKFRTFLKEVNPFINWSNGYISHKITDILNYDKNNKTEYAKTLQTYLSESQSPAKTGEILFIHKNTVIYRINKIKTMFNIDFSNANQCFQLYFSFQLLIMRGWKNH